MSAFPMIPFFTNPLGGIASLLLPLVGQSLATGQTLGLFFGVWCLHRLSVFSRAKAKGNLALYQKGGGTVHIRPTIGFGY